MFVIRSGFRCRAARAARGGTIKKDRDGDSPVLGPKIVLEPVNPDFQPIELTADDEDTVAVVAELVEVIGSSVTG